MPRVIQDSDDEGDLSTVSSPTSSAAKSPGRVAKSPSPRSTERSAPGTSSTEIVQRNIENTHQQFIQPTTASMAHPMHSHNHLEAHISSSRSPKRRRMMTTSELIASPARRLNRRGTVDLPSQTKSQQLEFEQPEEAGNAVDDNEVDTIQKESNQLGPDTRQWEQSEHSLLSSMKHDFFQHEPVMMFPEASSTIPNATMTQILLAAEIDANAAARDSDGHLVNSPGETKSSIPWSTYIESSKISSQSSRKRSGRSQAASEANVSLSSSRRTKSSQIPQDDKVKLQDSGSTSKRRTKTLDYGRYDQLSQDELANDSPLRATILPTTKRHHSTSPKYENHLTSPTGLLHNSLGTNGRELSPNHAHDDEQVAKSVEDSIRAVRLSKGAKKEKGVVSDTLNSDDIAIGLPKESYQPRPSRSRSKRVLEEPIDLSVRPEKAAKDKAKRRCTTGIVACGRLKLSLAEKIEVLEKKGFSQTQARLALEAKDNDLDSALQWLNTSSPTKTPESFAKNPATDLADTSRTADSSQSSDLQENLGPIPQAGFEPELHDVSGEHVQNTRTRPTSPRPSDLDTLPTAEAQPVSEGPHNTIEMQPSKKRGRGRPKKTETKGLESTFMQKSNNESHLEIGELPPNAVEADSDPAKPSEVNAKTSATNKGAEIPSATENETSTAPLVIADGCATAQAARGGRTETPQRQNSEINSGKPQTPQSNGKVPYRVGLSRRARIAPLLRSVKK
ncbi:hypothetical protein K490DRAFT_68786 [Saccharata proteae CBS 121410]|uniref:UBA domain-containing protein n=1 Tax=Saccharata proteae CBS 121410 TaxID=1314787 RepID=A0A9P4HPW5_9PEZI|nr:hypothetical protein K490DRAFT_68786 [Saccharata proteae CBS 121410]